MQKLKNFPLTHVILYVVILCLLWAQSGVSYAEGYRQQAHNQAELRAMYHPTHLRRGLTDTPSPSLQRKIAAREAALVRPHYSNPDVRPLTEHQIRQVFGRGVFRSPYYDGTLPWQKSFRDVNLCNGNLFKNFTDLQVAPGRGAGLTLNRTYNSNDATIGPFGVGWTHAYDIQMQEATDVAAQSGDSNADKAINDVPRKDFFGARHTYHRDADGLYSPPSYMFDEMSSQYGPFLAGGPTQVNSDSDYSMDGTVKHYTSEVTLANNSNGNDRYCDSITDRHGNVTTLTYGQPAQQADGSTRNLLTMVTDPDGRSLAFTWGNESGSQTQPAWRITQVQGPLAPNTYAVIPGVTETVAYSYYTSTSDQNVADDLYNLYSVTVDPSGLNRTTYYTYTHCSGNYVGLGGATTSGTENGLLASIKDPLGRVTTYSYTLATIDYMSNPAAISSGTVWVSSVQEPAGVTGGGSNQYITWNITPVENASTYTSASQIVYGYPGENSGETCVAVTQGTPTVTPFVPGTDTTPPQNAYYTYPAGFNIFEDSRMRCTGYWGPDTNGYDNAIVLQYDNANNLVQRANPILYRIDNQTYTYGYHGQVLTHSYIGWSTEESYTYYDASKYFQKETSKDLDGKVINYDYYADNDLGGAGNFGEVKSVEDPGYGDSSSPSYQRAYTYTYNAHGQKATETNLNGVVTKYVYGDGTDPNNPGDLGNLTQVVQDYGAGPGNLNRTTSMHYDWAGHVLQATDPLGNVMQTAYNVVGQTESVKSYAVANMSTPQETISYAYDDAGRTDSVSDNRGATTMAYVPNSDWVQSVTDPVTGTTGYTYDLYGDRLTMSLPGGGTWTYGYTNSGGAVGETFVEAAPPPSSDYFAFGGYRTYAQGNWTLSKQDDLDSLTLELASVTDDAGRKVSVAYTPDEHHLSSVTFNQVYNGQGQLAGSATAGYTYDSEPYSQNPSYTPNGTHWWLSQLATTWTPTSTGGGSTTPRLLQQNGYSYDDGGLRLTNTVQQQAANADGSGQVQTGTSAPILSVNRTETYGYDDLDRLTSVSYGDSETQGYGFDAMGNRLTKSDTVIPSGGGNATTTNTGYSYDAANRLTGVSTNGGTATPVTFDADGNTLSDSGGRTYAWDSENRMTSCTLPNGGGTTTFTYGSDGLRRSMTANGVTTKYCYDGTKLIREMRTVSGSLTPTATYLEGPRGTEYRRNDLTGVVKWYVYDGLGSVVGELDASGQMTTSQQFDVYGLPRTGTQQGTAPTSRQQFVGSLGHMTDAETGGLIYMQARYYDPGAGRFISEDTTGYGENWFTYCGDDPINGIDANGKYSYDPNSPPGIINELKMILRNVGDITGLGSKGWIKWIKKAGNSAAIAFIDSTLRDLEIEERGALASAAEFAAIAARYEAVDADKEAAFWTQAAGAQEARAALIGSAIINLRTYKAFLEDS